MNDPAPIARRVAGIAPLHVMEVQAAARALEAQRRSVVHMEVGDPDFPTPEAVCRAGHEVFEATGVAFTSGIDFGVHRAGSHVRFAYTVDVTKLKEGLARLGRYLATRQPAHAVHG